MLKLLFSVILVVMLAVTGWASLQESITTGGVKVLEIPWGVATLADAYCGFITFYAWVFYKESWLGRLLWFPAIMALGNIAMAIYVLWKLTTLPKGAGPEQLLLRAKL